VGRESGIRRRGEKKDSEREKGNTKKKGEIIWANRGGGGVKRRPSIGKLLPRE